MTDLDVPRVLYKPGSAYCRVSTPDELKRALAAGWLAKVPAGWSTTVADGVLASGPENEPPPAPSAAVAQPASAGDVQATIASLTDLRALQNLRLQETKGANRPAVLKAIDARIVEVGK